MQPKSSLYIFGDSFSADYPWLPDEENWSYHKIIAKTLNLEYKNFSAVGSGLEFTFEKFEDNRKFIEENDIVIICLTSLERTYFFPDKPFITNADSQFYNSSLSSDELTALKFYVTHFSDNHRRKMLTNTHNFLHSVNDLSGKMKNKILVLDGLFYIRDTSLLNNIKNNRYKNLLIPSGILNEVSVFEATSIELIHKIVSRHGGDGRINHICKINHEILSHKIINCYLDNKEIDLTQGFYKNIFSDINYYELTHHWRWREK